MVAAASIDDAASWAWRNGILDWKLHENQLLIHDQIESLPPGVKEAVILCCRRFGKSYYGSIRALMSCLRSPKKKLVRIIGPDIKQTIMIVEHNMAKITEELPRLGLTDLVQRVKSDNMYQVGKSGIFLGGFDSQKDSLRGGEADEILIEETGSSDADQYNYQMKSILKPQLLKTRGRMIHLTTLPPVPSHPFTNDTVPQAKLSNAFYSYTIYEDPLATPEIIADAIKDCGGVDSIAFRREYLNEVVRDTTVVVVPSFDRTRHVKAFEAPTTSTWNVAIDWGGVRDKTVALLLTYDFLSDLDLIWDEKVFPPNTSTSVIIESLRAWEREREIGARYADVPGQLLVDMNSTYDYTVMMPHKADWQANVNNVIARFAQNKIVVHKRCPFLATSLESGTLNKNRNDFERSEALGHCDAIAALMYGVRCLDRQNPWPYLQPSRDNAFVWPKEPIEKEIASAIVGKSFSTSKKFGAFR